MEKLALIKAVETSFCVSPAKDTSLLMSGRKAGETQQVCEYLLALDLETAQSVSQSILGKISNYFLFLLLLHKITAELPQFLHTVTPSL